MGNMEQHSVNALGYQLRDLWRSPRGTMLRIETLALLAIVLSFFLSIFGSCRRWSNRWIVQKGILAAQVLSLSLGTYSIGLMQSSPVKSEMYPIWAVSLLTLFGCVDPITTYIGLDFTGPLSKMVFQLCLYCGYVLLLMSVSTISGVGGNIAIGVLSAICFLRGFHNSLALVLPTRKRQNREPFAPGPEPGALAGDGNVLEVPLPNHHYMFHTDSRITMDDIQSSCSHMGEELGLSSVTSSDMKSIEDVCLGYSLSRLLERRFLGLDTAREMEQKAETFESLVQDGAATIIDYKKAFKVIEVELAFLYDVFFTSNEFLHYYEAKRSSLWVFASFVGICFVGVATAIPGTMTSHHRHHDIAASATAGSGTGSAGTVVVGTTTADLIITLVILVSLALLQLVQLMRCWTSNWARVTLAYKYSEARKQGSRGGAINQPARWWMRFRALVVCRINWFDRPLWQEKLGQHSAAMTSGSRLPNIALLLPLVCCCPCSVCYVLGYLVRQKLDDSSVCSRIFDSLTRMDYIGLVFGSLFISSDASTGPAVKLQEDDDGVKTCIAEFLGQIKNRRIGRVASWSSLFVENGLEDCLEYLPYAYRGGGGGHGAGAAMPEPDAYAFTSRVMAWHFATSYCQLAEQGDGEGSSHVDDSRETATRRKNHRRVAIALSRYCVYLVVSTPELLPRPSVETKRAYTQAMLNTTIDLEHNKLEAMQKDWESGDRALPTFTDDDHACRAYKAGLYLGKRLGNETPPPPPQRRRRTTRAGGADRWELLALLWVQTLLYAAPYGDVQTHLQHLSRGGEFITHLWALLYHIGIDRWEVEAPPHAGGSSSSSQEPRSSRSRSDAWKQTRGCNVQ